MSNGEDIDLLDFAEETDPIPLSMSDKTVQQAEFKEQADAFRRVETGSRSHESAIHPERRRVV